MCKDSAAPAHARTRAHRPAAPRQQSSAGVSQTPHIPRLVHITGSAFHTDHHIPPRRSSLWCGAAGLCTRVRACAGAAESLHTYIHT